MMKPRARSLSASVVQLFKVNRPPPCSKPLWEELAHKRRVGGFFLDDVVEHDEQETRKPQKIEEDWPSLGAELVVGMNESSMNVCVRSKV